MHHLRLISTIAISFLLASLISSCGGKYPAGEELTYNVRGTITDESGLPVPSARITVYEIWVNVNVTGNHEGFEEKVRVLVEAESDDSGMFVLTFPAHPGLKQISISREDYIEKNTTFLLTKEDTSPTTGPYVLAYASKTLSAGDSEEMLIKHE